jgi:excisionase family DNA binding protein
MKSPSAEADINEQDRLLTIKDVVRKLRYSEKTIRRLIRSGRLRAVKIGRCYRFRREDVTEFVRSALTPTIAHPRR